MNRLLLVLCIIWAMYMVAWQTWTLGVKAGKQQGVSCPVPVVVTVRGVDTHSPEELRRIAKARERMEKVK